MTREHWFDSLNKLLTQDVPRRGVLAAVAALTIGQGFAATDAAGKKGRNGGKSKQTGKKKGKKKKGGKSPTSPPGPPPPPSPPPPPASPCLDGIRNGSESDIDCGGTCPRCLNGRSCGDRNDCSSALCSNGTCQECAINDDCGSDHTAACQCRLVDGRRVCIKARSRGVLDCTECPDDTLCVAQSNPGPTGAPFVCIWRCGAP